MSTSELTTNRRSKKTMYIIKTYYKLKNIEIVH